jgi:hypothetical protein
MRFLSRRFMRDAEKRAGSAVLRGVKCAANDPIISNGALKAWALQSLMRERKVIAKNIKG